MQYKTVKTMMRSFVIVCLSLLLPAVALAQGRKLTGTVTDEAGEALIGATVAEVGSSKGVITDYDGNFSLSLSSGTQSIRVSFVGYKTKTVPVPASGKVKVQLEQDQAILQETVIVGYGVQRKSDLTGSVSGVSSKDFNQGVVNSPEQLINGKVSGVQIVNGGGSPSASSTSISPGWMPNSSRASFGITICPFAPTVAVQA